MYEIRNRVGKKLMFRVEIPTDERVPDDSSPFDEIHQAKLDVEARMLAWNLAEPGFEEAAWHAFRAATERLNALLREAKQGVGA